MEEKGVINYKIYLCASGYEPEVRRITITNDIHRNYFYLKQKLIATFPALKDVEFSISWKDEEGDTIRICSDEELVIALNEMASQPFKKLYLATVPQQENEGPIHPDIKCNGCDSQVQGFRYKCVVCPDYDLCADCERSQQHPDHPMIRIPLPMSLEGPFCQRFLNKISRHIDHLYQASERRERKEKGDYNRSESAKEKKSKRKGGCPVAAATSAAMSEGDPLSQLLSFLGIHCPQEEGPTNGEGDQPSNRNISPTEEQKKFCMMILQGLTTLFDPIGNESERFNPESAEGANTSESTVPEGGPQAPAPQRQEQARLNTIMQENISHSQSEVPQSQLQPQASQAQSQQQTSQAQQQTSQAQPQASHQTESLDIQPQIQAHTQPQSGPSISCQVDTQQQAHVQPQSVVENQSQPSQVQPQNAPVDKSKMINDFVKSLNLGAIPRTLARGYRFKGDRENSPVLDNSWTVIQDVGQERPGAEGPSETSSVNSASNVANGTLYAAIPVTPITASGQNIDETMSQLIDLGFVEEGGWLRQLVESKNGNLTEVLHFLTPIPKYQST